MDTEHFLVISSYKYLFELNLWASFGFVTNSRKLFNDLRAMYMFISYVL